MSMSVSDSLEVIIEFEVIAEEKRQCLFTTSLMNTTIQDGGKRKRSDII